MGHYKINRDMKKKVAKKAPVKKTADKGNMTWKKVGSPIQIMEGVTSQQYQVSMPKEQAELLQKIIADRKEVKKTVLQEAQELIYGDRQASYGSATENFTRIAVGWSEIAGIELTPHQVGLMMVWLKMARELHKPNRDNLVDACGYLGCVEKVYDGK